MGLTMRGRIDECVLLSLRTPAAAVASLVPRGLELVTLDAMGERWAFWSVAFCHVARMRPVGVPWFFGKSFHLVAFRLPVKATASGGGAVVRSGATTSSSLGSDLAARRDVVAAGHRPDGRCHVGLFFVRSFADSRMVCLGGNRFSDFRFQHSSVVCRGDRGQVMFASGSDDAAAFNAVRVDITSAAALAEGSVFASVNDARDFLKYTPLGMCPADDGQRVRLAEVVRDEQSWDERVVSVREMKLGFFEAMKLPEPVLELATRVAAIDYRWKLGRTEALGVGH